MFTQSMKGAFASPGHGHRHAATLVLLHVALLVVVQGAAAQGCSAAVPCADSALCCSKYGYCDVGPAYCGQGCQNGPCDGGSSPTPPTPSGGGSVFSQSVFEGWFPNRLPQFSYDAYTAAASAFSAFGTSGNSDDDRKREIAAFFANVMHETGGLAYAEEINARGKFQYCQADATYPCAAGKEYFGRGPLQLTWNYNYGPCGQALGLDLLNDPDQVASDGTTAFKAAIWFWMTRGCHDAILGGSFAQTIRDINSIECGHGQDNRVDSRVSAYTSFCQSLGVDPLNDLKC